MRANNSQITNHNLFGFEQSNGLDKTAKNFCTITPLRRIVADQVIQWMASIVDLIAGNKIAFNRTWWTQSMWMYRVSIVKSEKQCQTKTKRIKYSAKGSRLNQRKKNHDYHWLKLTATIQMEREREKEKNVLDRDKKSESFASTARLQTKIKLYLLKKMFCVRCHRLLYLCAFEFARYLVQNA